MPQEQDPRLLDLVAEALAIDSADRDSWLRKKCSDDHALRAEVESLLGCNDDAEDLLQLSDAANFVDPTSPLQPEAQGEAIGTMHSGDLLGDYQIVRQIGAGGMGIVYEAKQLSLNRSVALKVLPAYLRNSANALARFRREVEAAARLRHDNIVAVHTTGDDGVTSYYAMDLIKGLTLSDVLENLRDEPLPELEFSQTLTRLTDSESQPPTKRPTWLSALLSTESSASDTESLAENPTSLRATGNYFEVVADLLASVAEGLDYAHSNRIIHRDIKPSNLLLSEDGRLHISDFGLARIMAEPGVTQSGDFVGTPHYMAPEQINKKFGEIDGRTDVYALGATLYEVLTLRPPFPGSTRDEVLACIAHEEPVSPRRLNKRIPSDLETICLKAMDKDQDQRYQTSSHLANDLRCFVAQLPISARRSGVVARSIKWCRRHRSMAASLLFAGCLGLIAIGLAYNAHETTKEKHLAEQQRDSVAARASKIEQDLNSASQAVVRARQTEQERVFEQALLAAMQGDQIAVESAITRAEQLGAAAERLHVLQGQNFMFTADYDMSRQELQSAIELSPDNFAAHALLGETLARLEQWEESHAVLKIVRQLESQSIEDLILKGRLESYHNAHAAEQTLNQAVDLDRKNVAARLLRGIVRAKIAYDTNNPNDAERALEDFHLANSFLLETPYLLGELLSIHLTAAASYEAAGQVRKEQEHLEQAGVIAAKLEKYQGEYQAHRWRAYYFDQIGELDKSITEWQMIRDKTIGFLIMALCRAGRFEEALLECDQYEPGKMTGTSDFCHSFALATFCSSAEELIEDFDFETILTWNRNSARRSTFILWALAGELDRAAQEVRKLGIEESTPRHSHNMFKFVCEEITAAEYLDNSQQSHEELARAHLIIGVNRLSRGDRGQAREHFQQVAGYHLNYEFHTAIARALLAQLDRDPQWPAWIPES